MRSPVEEVETGQGSLQTLKEQSGKCKVLNIGLPMPTLGLRAENRLSTSGARMSFRAPWRRSEKVD